MYLRYVSRNISVPEFGGRQTPAVVSASEEPALATAACVTYPASTQTFRSALQGHVPEVHVPKSPPV